MPDAAGPPITGQRRCRVGVKITPSLVLLLLIAGISPALAHASKQAFVLLLPTEYYLAGGAGAVFLTLALISLIPEKLAARVFAPIPLARSTRRRSPFIASCLCFLGVLVLIGCGIAGADDPTKNPLPVFVWTVFWVLVIFAQGIFGNFWRWLNPWTGPLALLRAAGIRPFLRLPAWLGYWPGLVSFMAFAGFMLIHPAATDPEDLVFYVGWYLAIHFIGGLVFGPKWIARAEAFSVVSRCYGGLASVGRRHGRWRLGLPGWVWAGEKSPPLSLALFMVALLAVGSFEGLHETFFWFGWIGVNPLDYEGRSTVILSNSLGLFLAVPVLMLIFAAALWAGVFLSGQSRRLADIFCAFAPALLPIALAYHFAHYLPSLLVDIQYLPIVLNDPFANGAAWLGFGDIHVTAGFFNRLDSVRVIWTAMVAAVVIGHMVSILMSHHIAIRLFGSSRRATISQIPIASFMILYTFFGLWLLASPQAG